MTDIGRFKNVPDAIEYAATRESVVEGITPEEWIDKYFIYNPNAGAEDEAFWNERRRRARNHPPGTLQRLLDSLPNVPPVPGDELE